MGLIIFALIVAANIAGLAIYMATRDKPAREVARSEVAADPVSPTSAVSRAQRAAGLAALEAGQYDDAVRYFTDASKSDDASPDLPQLLKIAMDLREKAPSLAANKDAKPVVASAETPKPEPQPEVKEEEPEPSRSTSREEARRREREREQREREKERERRARAAARAAKPEPEPEAAPQPGTIVISSTPPGLMVQLDGKTLDATPLRVTAEPGAHEIALLEGSTVVFNKRLNVVAGSLQSVDPDVSAQVNALRAPAKPPEPQPSAQPTLAGSGGLTTPPPEQPKEQPRNAAPPPPPTNSSNAPLDESALYVVAHPSLGLTSISSEQLSSIFMGKTTTLNGRKLEPILRSPSSGAGAVFLKRIVRVTTRQYRDHWQKVELSGAASAPPIINNTADVWRAVTSRGGAISFALGSELAGAPNVKPVRITQ